MGKLKYSQDVRDRALAQCRVEPVRHVADRMGISLSKLYKWMAEAGIQAPARVYGYSQGHRTEILAMAQVDGVPAAAAAFKVAQSTVTRWRHDQRPSNPPADGRRKKRVFSDEFKQAALARAEQIGPAAAAAEATITSALMHAWLNPKPRVPRADSTGNTKVTILYSNKQKEHALARVTAIGIVPAARELEINQQTLRSWAVAAAVVLPTARKVNAAPELRVRAVALANDVGIDKAASTLGVTANQVRYWLARIGKPQNKYYSDDIVRSAVAQARATSNKRAAMQLGIAASTVAKWVARADATERVARRAAAVTPSEELRKTGIELSQQLGVKAAAIQLKVSPRAIQKWRSDAGIAPRNMPTYSEPQKVEAVALAREIGPLRAAAQLGIKERTVSRWLKDRDPESAARFRRIYRSTERSSPVVAKPLRAYTAEQIKEAVELAQSAGLREAAAIKDIPFSTIRNWCNAANIKFPRRQKYFDVSLAWMQDYPQLHCWREPAQRWIENEERSIEARLMALSKLLLEFVVRQGLPSEPTQFLSRSVVLPDFYSTCCPNSSHGISLNNFAREFLEWFLLNEMSTTGEDDEKIVLPIFKNPISRRSHAGVDIPTETVYTPLPYGYIEDLRAVLAGGSNFRDWLWANGLDRPEENVTSGDWFEVTVAQIDGADPDCVYRRRLRTDSGGGEILEMWSPVRWVGLLLKLILPLRTFQVRMLDSGESDTWRSSGFSMPGKSVEWGKNNNPLAEGSASRPVSRGAIRRPTQSLLAMNRENSEPIAAILYANTNKTADIAVRKRENGYEIPWTPLQGLLSDPYYWIEKLVRWQEKYNPIVRKTSWDELDQRHRSIKSKVVLATYPDTCFLFRLPENSVAERGLPLTDSAINLAWHRLLSSFESLLWERGSRLPNGERIRFVPENQPKGHLKTYFPLHSLRVSLITSLALEGKVPFPILSRLVGHSRLIMTLYYTKPNHEAMARELAQAAGRLEAQKEQGLIDFLKSTERAEIERNAICNSPASLSTVIPEHPLARNATGWKPLFNGICLAGGNVNAFDSGGVGAGCFNGGENVGSPGKPRWLPVPGGAHNCTRCRWFVTSAAYLWALVSQYNVLMYHMDEARIECVRRDDELQALKLARLRCEEAGSSFGHDEEKKLRGAQRVWEAAIQRFDDRTQDAAACAILVMRCVESLNERNGSGPANQLVAVGGHGDLKVAVNGSDSELAQLTEVCSSVEAYPELQAGKAVVRRSQILDMALSRDGISPIFLKMSEEEQMKSGNIFLKQIGMLQNPVDPSDGKSKIVSLIDAGGSFSKIFGDEFKAVLSKIYDVEHAPALMP